MTDRKTGETTFTLRGTVYRLKLDSDAMVAMEEAASTPDRRVFFHQIMALAQAGSWTHQRILVWASLRLHHGEITLKQAGDLMLDSATEELNRSMSDLAVEATGPGGPRGAGGGAIEGPSGAADAPREDVGWDWDALYRHGRRVGLTHAQFWGLTIRALFREFATASARRRDEHDAAVTLAWQTAALSRAEKLPALPTLLARAHRTGPPQTRTEQTTMLHLFSDQLGIPLRRVRLTRREVA